MNSKNTKPKVHLVPISEANLLCLWAAVVLREPEPLTRLLKKLLKPTVARLDRRTRGGKRHG